MVVATGRAMARHGGTLTAAGVAFYALLSLFPLILGLLSLFSLVLESEFAHENLLGFFREYLPGAEALLSSTFASHHAVVHASAGFVSVAALFWAGSAMFGGISQAFRLAWGSRSNRDFLVEKLRHMVMALTVGVLFALSMASSTALEFLATLKPLGLESITVLENHAMNAAARLVPFAITSLVFLLLYKFVPDFPTRWRHIWPGVLLAAALFEIAKAGFVLYLSEYADYAEVYGALGPIVALMVWTYLCSLILIVGAEFASQYGQMRDRQARRGSAGPAVSS